MKPALCAAPKCIFDLRRLNEEIDVIGCTWEAVDGHRDSAAQGIRNMMRVKGVDEAVKLDFEIEWLAHAESTLPGSAAAVAPAR